MFSILTRRSCDVRSVYSRSKRSCASVCSTYPSNIAAVPKVSADRESERQMLEGNGRKWTRGIARRIERHCGKGSAARTIDIANRFEISRQIFREVRPHSAVGQPLRSRKLLCHDPDGSFRRATRVLDLG